MKYSQPVLRCVREGADTVSRRPWHLWDVRDDDVRDLCRGLDVDPLLARILLIRGLDGSKSFFQPSLRDDMPDPDTLADMTKAAQRIAAAVRGRQTIAVFGDYDVDGMASSALFQRYMQSLGRDDLCVTIADRMTDGYGATPSFMRDCAKQKVDLVITLDCGVSDHEALEEARKLSLDVIVVDHHMLAGEPPPALAIIDPKRLDDDSGLDGLCAGGLTFMLVVAVNRVLRQSGYFQKKNEPREEPGNEPRERTREEPDLIALLDLAALATICDLAPLTGFNRVLVTRGLQVMNRQAHRGIRALTAVAKLTPPFRATDAGFGIGPRLNACGRIGNARQGFELLATDDADQAFFLAERLDGLNRQRQKMERLAVDSASAEVGDDNPIVVASPHWHPGVIGLIAARLVERFSRSAFVFSLMREGMAIGSARATMGENVGTMIKAAKDGGWIERGGGHAAAGGMTLAASGVDDLRRFLREIRPQHFQEKEENKAIAIDAMISSGQSGDLITQVLNPLEPFGMGNPAPRILLSGAVLENVRVFADYHMGARLRDTRTGGVNLVAFRSVGSPLGDRLRGLSGTAVDAVGWLRPARRGGSELHLQDIAPADVDVVKRKGENSSDE